MEHEHEETVLGSWADNVAALTKLENELEALRVSLLARGALTPDKNLELDELLIQIIEKRLELWRESLGV